MNPTAKDKFVWKDEDVRVIEPGTGHTPEEDDKRPTRQGKE